MRHNIFGPMRPRMIASLLAASGALTAACLYDADQRCGPDQEFSEDLAYCICVEGTAWTEDGCQKCGRNEVIGAAGCECRTGYERVDGRCEEAPEPEPPPEPGDGGAGDGGGASEPPPEPEPEGPDGLGMSCQTDADCAGTEAEYCDLFVTFGCLVAGCSIGGDDCPTGYECQDLSGFGGPGPVCVAAVCDIDAQDCPDGFTCCESMPGFPTVCLAGGCGG